MDTLFTDEPAWFCLQALPKKEHIAAQLLRVEVGLETFCPRISYVKRTQRGKVRFIEPLFPGYLFVHCAMVPVYRRILATQGVRRLVVHGNRAPTVPASFIDGLQAQLDAENLRNLPEPEIKPGTPVQIVSGPFQNW
jgi:transcriptional antiterminator RfaH